jgi:SAM-dependent methyltransferase
MIDPRGYNREAWDHQVRTGCKWTVPVGPEVIARARAGEIDVVLTPNRPVPSAWLGGLAGKDVLCLASGGGQQAPVFAAAGATVTLLDQSPAQLGRDREVAEREALAIELVEGDMADLSPFEDESFDLVFHPCSNCFVPDIHPVWRECYRVLRPGGRLLSGFTQPIAFCFDPDLEKEGTLVVKYGVPYSDVTSLTDEERRRYTDAHEPIVFGHTLEDQLGGQMRAGFVLVDLFEDRGEEGEALTRYLPGYMATLARKGSR